MRLGETAAETGEKSELDGRQVEQRRHQRAVHLVTAARAHRAGRATADQETQTQPVHRQLTRRHRHSPSTARSRQRDLPAEGSARPLGGAPRPGTERPSLESWGEVSAALALTTDELDGLGPGGEQSSCVVWLGDSTALALIPYEFDGLSPGGEQFPCVVWLGDSTALALIPYEFDGLSPGGEQFPCVVWLGDSTALALIPDELGSFSPRSERPSLALRLGGFTAIALTPAAVDELGGFSPGGEQPSLVVRLGSLSSQRRPCPGTPTSRVQEVNDSRLWIDWGVSTAVALIPAAPVSGN